MNSKFGILFTFAALVVSVQSQATITVSNGATLGAFASQWSTCPEGSKAVAYDTANQYPGFGRLDETALDSIRLWCDTPDGWTNITSSVAGFTESYDLRYDCPKDTFLVAFRLRVQPIVDDPADFDNTAANNIHFRCSDLTEIKGIGNTEGEWGDWSLMCAKGICGMKTRVLRKPFAPSPSDDNTALNDVQFQCCL